MAKPKMKRKQLPDFEKMSLEEIAEFWETHDSADYWDQMEDVTDQFRFKRSAGKIVSVRIAEEDFQQLRRITSESIPGRAILECNKHILDPIASLRSELRQDIIRVESRVNTILYRLIIAILVPIAIRVFFPRPRGPLS